MTLSSLFRQVFFSPEWTVQRIPDLSGKICIVTGGSSGIGTEIVRELAWKGAHVFVVGRNKEKTMAVINSIIEETSNKKVEFLKADFIDLSSVEQCADEFLKRGHKLHLLVNNAGIFNTPFCLSKQEIESQYAVNHFATVVFTSRLLNRIVESQPSRIVNLSSFQHVRAGPNIILENMNDESLYDPVARYCETKLAIIQYTKYLQEKLKLKAPKVFVNACHPGLVKTEIDTKNQYQASGAIDNFLGYLFKISPNLGAITPLYVAADPEIETKDMKGLYFVPYACLADPSTVALDSFKAQEMWIWTRKVLCNNYRSDWDYNV